jgi:F0F1-type ATP synthase membrane subunit b/b'
MFWNRKRTQRAEAEAQQIIADARQQAETIIDQAQAELQRAHELKVQFGQAQLDYKERLAELEEKRRKEVEHNKQRDARIAELKGKNAELTARLCNKFQQASKGWPDGRKQRAGRKLSKELENTSEGCATWCITQREGKLPPDAQK